jgi:predicted dehydrogenase
MGIQIHSASEHKTIVARVQSGLIGQVSEVHSWSGKQWGDKNPRPNRKDDVPKGLDWDGWLGVAAERPYIGGGYYHPGNWRKRLDFGTGTFGDMGCHILDPVFAALELTAPTSVRSEGDAPNDDSWGLNTLVKYTFPQTKHTTKEVSLTWYNGDLRPDAALAKKIGIDKFSDQGSIIIGSEATLYCPYIAFPILWPGEKFAAVRLGRVPGDNHYLQFVEACRGNGATSAPFAYSGPLTESVLLGCLATRFPKTTLNWDAEKLKVTNEDKANEFVRRKYRKGYGAEGL